MQEEEEEDIAKESAPGVYIMSCYRYFMNMIKNDIKTLYSVSVDFNMICEDFRLRVETV